MGQTLRDAGIETEQIERLNNLQLNCFSVKEGSRAVPELHHERLQDGDRLLLCTDGLSDMLPDSEIADVVRRWPDAQAACDALIERALERGGRDNVTVALAQIEVLDSPPQVGSVN
jgi:serine/threonine protein phosphatase PrpC